MLRSILQQVRDRWTGDLLRQVRGIDNISSRCWGRMLDLEEQLPELWRLRQERDQLQAQRDETLLDRDAGLAREQLLRGTLEDVRTQRDKALDALVQAEAGIEHQARVLGDLRLQLAARDTRIAGLVEVARLAVTARGTSQEGPTLRRLAELVR